MAMGALSALVAGGVGRPLAGLLPQCRGLAPRLQLAAPNGLRKVLLPEATGPARPAVDLRVCSSSLAEASSRLEDSVLALAEPDAVQDAKLDAWYMDTSQQDQRLPHRLEPNEPVSLEELRNLGVVYWKLDADNAANDPKLQAIRAVRGYTYEDVISVSPDKLPGYEEKIKSFFEEHIHSDEEIRFVLDGSGYFDVRDRQDRWIRIDCRKGDMIVLPEGIYHRFTLDENNYIKAMRLFVGDPVWTPLNRPQDNHASRQKYIEGHEALRLASAS